MKNKFEFKTISINMVILFISILILTNFFINPKEIKAITDRESISILEIQPENKFKLTNKTQWEGVSREREELSNKYNGKKVFVTHMTMQEYISKVEKVNGKYDIVVVGSYDGRYTASFTSGPKYLPYGDEIRNRLLNGGKIEKTKYGGKWNKSYLEYYSENDITTKRAKELIEMINSGQLVYMSNEAILSSTKLESNFGSISKGNFIKTAEKNITVENVIKRYVGEGIQYRPILNVKSKPENNNRNMNYIFDLIAQDDNPITVNLYLDVNGDSLYKDKELVKRVTLTPVNRKVENANISYTLPNDFVGQLTWKLEVEVNKSVTGENIKSYEIGSINYSAYSEKKTTIRVLQLYPDGKNLLSLDKDETIQNLIKGISDYEIKIDKKDITTFNKEAGNIMKLNGKYDMVILGFADCYGNFDLSDNTISELKSFIKTGQSVMFTHDALIYKILPDEVVNDYSDGHFAKNATYAFRDVIGQSRYKDIEYNPSQEDIYMKYNVSSGEYITKIIPHDEVKDTSKITYGLSDGILKMFNSEGNAGSYSVDANQINKINSGLISEYPYQIGNISVAGTHYQYFQLNLEDEDVVPWYTLINESAKPSAYNKYDARNYYYTYSKGNITYSGTGHSNGFTPEEKKLFVNTMVKASRGANHAPTLEVINLDDNKNISKNQEEIRFTVIPYDMDNDKLDLNITIRNASGQIVGNPITYSNQNQDVPINISLSKTDYDFSKMGGKITVEIKVEDPLKAKSEILRNINLVNDPTVTLQYSTDKVGYLKGDTAKVTLEAIGNPGEIKNIKISNIKFTPDVVENDKYRFNLNEVGYTDITFDSSNNPNPKKQSKNIDVNVKGEGKINISGKLSYNYNGREITQPYDITLVSQIGKVNVSIKDENGQLVKGGKITVTPSNDKIPSIIKFNGEIKEFNEVLSGKYSFNLEPFYIGDLIYTPIENTKTLEMKYDPENSIKTIEFIVTNSPEDNNLPNIDISLLSATPNPTYPENEVTLTYKVNPQDFTTKILKSDIGTIDEVMFISDISTTMKSNQRFSQLQIGITNSILNKNNLNLTKFGLIGYSDKVLVGDRNNIDSPKDVSLKSINGINELNMPLFSINDNNSKDGYRKLFQENKIIISESNIRNIDGALNMAKDIFDNFGDKNKRKAIVLINSGEVNYSKEVAKKIKNEEYKIISLDLSVSTNTNLKELHKDLGGIINDEENQSDYLIGNLDGGQNYNDVDKDMLKVEERLVKGVILGGYGDVNPKLYFDLNDNFEYVQESNSQNISIDNYRENNLVLNMSSAINYRYIGELIDGKYKYSAAEQVISFKVKPKAGKIGDLSFGANITTYEVGNYKNYMSYIKFNESENKVPINTPIITVKEEIKNVTHGLYNGIIDKLYNEIMVKEVSIQENNNCTSFEIAQDSTVTFGSKFTLGGNSVDFALNIDNKFNTVSTNDIKIYKILKDSSGNSILTEITNGNRAIESQGDNNFKISINNIKESNQTSESDILVVYQARVKDEISMSQSLTNEIKFSNLSKAVNIITPQASDESPNLPDLF